MATVLNQALGTIETRTASKEHEGDTLPADRETRMRLIAELEQRLTDT